VNRIDPPGFLDDLSDADKDRWSRIVSGWLDEARQGNPNENDGPRAQFFNPLTNPPANDAQVATISWNAFPRQVKSDALSDKQRWRRADSDRNLQDEYCEWSVTRDPVTQKITRVTFTCEGPEYWSALAHGYPDGLELPRGHPAAKGSFDTVVQLYRRYVSPDVKPADLKDGRGHYDPLNKWNTSAGAMHLTHPSNNLMAEVFLAADATVLRQRGDGPVLDDDAELIRCALYGEETRASDPTIGGAVNSLARAGALVGLRNPVGLYIDSIDTTGWSKPDGTPVDDYWKVLRPEGDASAGIVRARYEVPASEGFVVSDIKIAGEPIEFAGQIAEHITMKLTGVAAEVGGHRADPVGCVDDRGADQVDPVGAEDARIARRSSRRRASV
jgi:hypothetical protein